MQHSTGIGASIKNCCRTARGIPDQIGIDSHAVIMGVELREAFPLIGTVPQPLWPLVAEKEAVQAALSGVSRNASCKVNLRGFQQYLTPL